MDFMFAVLLQVSPTLRNIFLILDLRNYSKEFKKHSHGHFKTDITLAISRCKKGEIRDIQTFETDI